MATGKVKWFNPTKVSDGEDPASDAKQPTPLTQLLSESLPLSKISAFFPLMDDVQIYWVASHVPINSETVTSFNVSSMRSKMSFKTSAESVSPSVNR